MIVDSTRLFDGGGDTESCVLDFLFKLAGMMTAGGALTNLFPAWELQSDVS